MKCFLFAPESPYRLAAMRIGLGLVLLYDAAPLWPFVVELYSSAGMPMPLYPGTIIEPAVPGAAQSVLLYALLLFSLTCVVLGWQTRLSLLLAFSLTAWFGLLDMAGTFKKYSVIGLHLTLLLVFTRCAAVWSIDARLSRHRGRFVRLSPLWPRRLMQFLLAGVYLGAVVTKIRMPDFGTGDLMMFSLLDERWGGNWFGMWLATKPRLIVLASFATILTEMAAVFLLWIQRTRFPMLVILVLFHASIGWSMHVGIFSPMMLVALLAFTEESDVQRLRRICRRFRPGRSSTHEDWARHSSSKPAANSQPAETVAATPAGEFGMTRFRQPLISLGIYVLVAAAFACAGYAQQSAADYSGVFVDGGSVEWEYFDRETMDEINDRIPPNPASYFHRVQIGSRLGYLQTFGESKVFRRGMTVHLVVRLLRNHPDLTIEWILITPDGKNESRHKRPLTSAATYTSFGFAMTSEDYPTGTYTIVIKAAYSTVIESEGEVVAKKTFELIDD